MKTQNYYTLKDIVQLTGCTHRQLQYWEKKGYLKPQLGPRNVRIFKKSDTETIQNLIAARRSGKTLGEAWADSMLFNTTQNPLFASLSAETLNQMSHLSTQWLAENTSLIEQLHQVGELEKNMPGYPYTLYKPDILNNLQKCHEQIKFTINKRDAIAKKMRSHISIIQKNNLPVDLTEEEKNINTTDALILYWIKSKGGNYSRKDLRELRETLSDRLRKGESFHDIIVALKSLSETSIKAL